MRRWLLAPLALLAASCSGASDEHGLRPGETKSLTIYSTTDTEVFVPVIEDFRQLHPNVEVRYVELDAAPLYERFVAEAAAGQPAADLLLSSAMDLQVKLVNDGYAAPHMSVNAQRLPSWARWREEAFGITFEPAVMVFNRRLMAGRRIPRSRPELLDALREDRAFWRGRIGTYDIAKSSVGYLIASQDARQSNQIGALVEAFGDAGLQSHDNAATLLDRLERGELAVGYNVLGSYARARTEAGAPLVIVYPEDYTLAVARTAVLAKDAPHPEAAHAFLEYLLSLRGQRVLSNRSHLHAVREEIGGPYGRLGISEMTIGPLRPIALGPGLLVYLDGQKRQRMLENWRAVTRKPH